MERPYTGLTASIKINNELIGYMNNVSLDMSKDVAEILQFGAQYKEKVPTIKDWNATADGTVAFVAGGSQEKLYLAFESGELVTLTFLLDENVYYEGDALVSSLNIDASPDKEITLSAEFSGSGALTLELPQTVNVVIRSGVGGTTNPAGQIRVAKGSTLTVKCLPSDGKTGATYTIDDGEPQPISLNTFTTSALNADTVIGVKFTEA